MCGLTPARSVARSIETRDQLIDPVFAINAVVKRWIGERPRVDIEAVAQVEHGARRGLELLRRRRLASGFLVEVLEETQAIRTWQGADGFQDLPKSHARQRTAFLALGQPPTQTGSTAGRLRAGRPVDPAMQAACGGAEEPALRSRRAWGT